MTVESRQPPSVDEGQESAAVAIRKQPDAPNENNPPTKNQSNSDDKADSSGIPGFVNGHEPPNQPKANQSAARQDHGKSAEADEVIGIQRDLRDYTGQLATYTKALMIATVLLVVVGATQLYFFGRTVEDTGKAATAAEESAIAASKTVKSINDIAERQLRAYVSIVRAEMVVHGKKLHATLTAKNSGQTPAYEFISWSKSSLQRSSKPFIAPKFGEKDKSAMVFIGPGEIRTFRFTEEIPEADSHTLAELESGRTVLYVTGRMEYQDAFDHGRYAEFRMTSLHNEDGEWGFQAAPDGNKAD